MAQQTKELPAGWGDDRLSEYVGTVHGNTMFIFESRKAAWSKLQEVDEIFLRLLDGPPRQVISFLFFLCHSAYRAAIILGTGGQLTEAYAVLRVGLEDALYAAFIAGDEERFKRWASRDGDEASLKVVKNEFRIADVIADLRSKAPRIATIAQELYDRTIDLGAHPNPMALFSRLHPDDATQEGTFRVDYTSEQDSVQLQLAIKTTCQVGTCCLDIAQLLFPERFKVTLLSDALEKARIGL